MKLLTALILAGALAQTAACATAKESANSGAAQAKKELKTADDDAKKNADFVEGEVKKETEDKKDQK